MDFSQMSSREKTILIVLALIIVLALVGIGILAARLLTGGEGATGDSPITVVPTAAVGASTPEVTITLVATPALEELAVTTPEPVSDQLVAVAREESPGPLLPVLLTNSPLHAGHNYRLEITAKDGSSVAIRGSWSQAALSAAGGIAADLPEMFEGTTPYSLEITAPIADPSSWSVSASAAPKELFGEAPILVITLYDATGTR